MNYYILGIAIILIILMMGTKKREGFREGQSGYRVMTDWGGTRQCPEGSRITTLAECEKAAKALGKTSWPSGTGTANTQQGNWPKIHPSGCIGGGSKGNYEKYFFFNTSVTDWSDHGFSRKDIPPICGKGHNTEGELITTPASSWDQAEAYCKQQGRNLVSIHSDADNTKVINYMKENTTSSYPWLGGKTTSGNKSKNLSDYKWTDGTQFDYKASTWHTNDNAPTHVHLYRDGAWGTWTGSSQGICGPKGGWKKPEKGCKSMDGRYSMGDGRRYTGGWALSNGEGDRTKCKALCESQPECKITGQYCNSTAYPSDNRCYCQFGDGCKKDEEGEVKCRFTVDNIVDQVKYNGKIIKWSGKIGWDNPKEFSFTPVPGGVLEIKGHESNGVAGCKNSGLLLECESSKHPKWNHWGSNEKDWTTGDGRPVCISTSGFYLKGAKGYGKKIWDSNNNVENKWGAVTLVGSPDGGAAWVKCADEGGKCKCSGRVRYGKNKTWGKILDVQGDINCNNSQAWGDPMFGTRKECQCSTNEDKDKYSFLFDGCPRGSGASSHKMLQNETSFEKCKEICSNDPKCNAFEINECEKKKGDYPDSCNKRCYNFYGDGSDIKNGGCVTDGSQKAYKKVPKGGWTEKGPCKEDDDYDHWGADIEGSPYSNVESSSACCDKCKENPDCKSWTWGKVDGSWSKKCWIKNKKFGSSGQRTKKSGLISGQSPPRPAPIPAPKSGRVANPDCVKYNWSDWGPCNRMCAGGTQTRIRTNNGFCIEGGKVRYFDSEKRECNTQECPRGPTGQQGQLGLGGPRGPKGQKGPTGKSGGGTGFPGKSGVVGGDGPKGNSGETGPKGEAGFRGEEGKVMSKAQVNNDLLSGIYEQLLKVGGVSKEDYSNLEPFNNPNYD